MLDADPREIELPEVLAAALANEPAARAAFDRLAPSRRKELARRVNDAKRTETRTRRVAEVIDTLLGS